MNRPVTLFTGQWADLPLEELAAKCAAWGFDGLELACWGDHFEVDKAVADPGYAKGQRELLERHGLGVLGDRRAPRRPGGLRSASTSATARSCRRRSTATASRRAFAPRAAERMKDTARAAAQLGVTQVNGFTGSSIWHLLYSFPPNDFAAIERGIRGVRRALGADPRRVRRRGRALRPRGAPDRDRLRLRHHPQGARRDREPRGVRHQLRPEPLRPPVPRHGAVRARVRRPDLPRPRQGLAQAPRRAPLDPRRRTSTSARRPAAGTSSRRATATSTSRTSSGR